MTVTLTSTSTLNLQICSASRAALQLLSIRAGSIDFKLFGTCLHSNPRRCCSSLDSCPPSVGVNPVSVPVSVAYTLVLVIPTVAPNLQSAEEGSLS